MTGKVTRQGEYKQPIKPWAVERRLVLYHFAFCQLMDWRDRSDTIDAIAEVIRITVVYE